MIHAMIFDMDGTLVKTEQLKALAYAQAVQALHPDGEIREEDVEEQYKQYVGEAREEVARGLMEHYGLEEAARRRMDEFDAEAPWQAFTRLRLRYYDAMIADAETVRARRQPVTLRLLEEARASHRKTALATTSDRPTTDTVLRALGLTEAFDTVVTADDVKRVKPDPEAYQLVARRLNVVPEHCLVIEDSPAGVKAALAAGMHCLAAPTAYTRATFREDAPLDARWIAWEREELPALVAQFLDQDAEQGRKETEARKQ